MSKSNPPERYRCNTNTVNIYIQGNNNVVNVLNPQQENKTKNALAELIGTIGKIVVVIVRITLKLFGV